MDPITAALIAGAAAASGDVVSQAIKDAYNGLKSLIQRKFAKAGTAITAVEEDPKDDAAHALVKKRLDEANASADAEIVAAAEKLTSALKAAGIAPQVSNTISNNSGIAVQGSTVTGDIVQGDKIGGNKIGTQINHYNTAPELSAINNADARAIVPLLNEYFSISDIDGLCFEMGIDDEQLRGQTKDEKARSLVKYVEDRGRLDELKKLMRVARPNLRDRLK